MAARLQGILAEVRSEAVAAGVSQATLERALAGLEPDPTIPDLLAAQPEHVFTPWDYLGRLVSEKRIADGRRMLAEHAAMLARIEAESGVDRHIVLAVWGVETSYGTQAGARHVVRSLATLAAVDRRRPQFWRKELIAALRILDRGDIAVDRMTGSWAGAMGHTQFMPSSYLAHAVDHDGDGRRDIWGSIGDALASAAAYLRRSGWKAGEPWGLEVVLPAGFDLARAAPRATRSAEDWQLLGLSTPFGADWPAGLPASSLLLPAGRNGPAFLVAPNFEAILRYNNAVSYALAVGHLADRLAGRPGIAALWPTDDPPLDRSGRIELQERLGRAGLYPGPVDGVIGEGTRSAVRALQERLGLAQDGWPGARLLERLRESGADGR